MSFRVAIIGRPNVGKSTFFNRLCGKKLAIVHDMPGVTRDRQEALGRIGPIEFELVDTAGIEKGIEASLEARMTEHSLIAASQADLVFFVVDGKMGLEGRDEYFARMLRKLGRPVVLVANKCESHKESLEEFYQLGFGTPIPISAEHGDGMNLLYEALEPVYDEFMKTYSKYDIQWEDNPEKAIQIAIVGRPNAGKSTFINKVIREERLLVGPEAGITRDSISIESKYKGQKISLIDTAGLRKKGNIEEEVELLAFEDSLHSIRFAHIVVLMVDAEIALEKQDLTIASIALDEGRPLILAINKWDRIEEKSKYVNELNYRLAHILTEVKDLPILYISALEGHNIYKVLDASLESYEKWNYRVPTAKLNDWLKFVSENHPLPLGKNNRRLRIKYITQKSARPPSFIMFTSSADDIPDSYQRYLKNNLREHFGFLGVPLRFKLKKSKNPYVKKK